MKYVVRTALQNKSSTVRIGFLDFWIFGVLGFRDFKPFPTSCFEKARVTSPILKPERMLSSNCYLHLARVTVPSFLSKPLIHIKLERNMIVLPTGGGFSGSGVTSPSLLLGVAGIKSSLNACS
jgi:hypothetical protein